MTKPKIELGQKWKTRGGKIVTIVENTGHNLYPWCAGDGESYTDSGLYRSVRTDDRDLMELIEDTPVKKAGKPALSVGQKWMRRDGEIVTIVENTGHNLYPWITEDCECYTDGGRYSSIRTDDRDLIELIEDTPKSALDVQVGGAHYKDMAIQPVEFIHKNGIGFIPGNVIKYVCRADKKGGLEDLQKARHYLDLLIEMEGQK